MHSRQRHVLPTTGRRSPRYRQRKTLQRRWLYLGLIVFGSSLITYHKIWAALQQPEAIFVLGGHEEREKFAAQLAQQHPNLDIWVSSGSPPDYVRHIFEKYGISGDRLHLDYQAEDTVTNFTSLVDDLQQRDIDSVYLVTSANHMQRAKIVSDIVFGSRGIETEPLPVPSNNPPETKVKCLRDGLRAMLWLITGDTGRQWQTHNPISALAHPHPTADQDK